MASKIVAASPESGSHPLLNETSSSECSKDTVIERVTELDQSQAIPIGRTINTGSPANGRGLILADGDESVCKVETKMKPVGESTQIPSCEPSTSFTANVTNDSVVEDGAASDKVSSLVKEKFAEVAQTAMDVVETSNASELDATSTNIGTDTVDKPHDATVKQVTLKSRVASGSLQAAQNDCEETSSAVSQRVVSPIERASTPFSRPSSADVRTTTSLPTHASRSRSVSTSHPPNMHYRAATVCAAGVAVALFFVVMRRLSLMLHGI